MLLEFGKLLSSLVSHSLASLLIGTNMQMSALIGDLWDSCGCVAHHISRRYKGSESSERDSLKKCKGRTFEYTGHL
jgi:hypothetical protein